MQTPNALSIGEDETDLTSFNAYKARQRGAYQDEYLIDQMYSRQMIGQALYGVRPMFGSPLMSRNMIMWGYRSPIWAYQNSFYFNSFNRFGNPWGYGYMNSPWNYGFGNSFGFSPYGPCYNGFHGNGFNPFFNNCYGNGFGNGNFAVVQNNPESNNSGPGSYFTGRPRMSLSSNSSRSSSYPNTLKSGGTESSTPLSINDQTQGTSRRAVQEKQVVSGSHMPFAHNNSNTSAYKSRLSSTSSNPTRGITATRSRNYSPSNSARRDGLVRSPRSNATTTSRTGYSSSQIRRSSTSNSGFSRGSSSSSPRTTTSSSSRSSSGGSSSGGSSSRRR